MTETTSSANKILVVDDDNDTCRIFEVKLKSKGHVVETVQNGSDALCHIYRFKPDVVLLDIAMPGLEGNELIRAIKAFWPGIEIFMITGLKNQKLKEECLEKGALAYFDKPVDFDQLDSELNKVFQEKKNTTPTYKALTEDEMREVEFVLKLLEKKELITREEMLEELQEIKGRKG